MVDGTGIAHAMTRRWIINGRFLGQPLTGVQRYARQIVRALDEQMGSGHPLAQDLALEIVAPRGVTDDLGLVNIPVRSAGSADGHLWEQLSLPREVMGGGLLSLCNTGPIGVRHQVICMHDVNTRLVPHSYSWRFRAAYRALAPALGRTATRLTTVSEFSAAQIARFNIAPADKIVVVSNGHEHVHGWRAQHSPATRAAAGPRTIVVIGSPAPHKNVGMLLGLADALAAEGFRLAIVGASDPRVFAGMAQVNANANVTMLGRLSDGEIAALLRDSLCLAVPSFTEGFGLPPLEAMALGCPVVASDRGSLPEICGSAALYAPPDMPAEWLAQFRRLAADQNLRKTLCERGAGEAERFSWSRSAAAYLELIDELDASRARSRRKTIAARQEGAGQHMPIAQRSGQADAAFAQTGTVAEARDVAAVSQPTQARMPVRLAIGIATSGRPAILAETLQRLGAQTRPADRIVVCAPGAADVAGADLQGVEFISSARGLPKQRNAIVDALADCDVVLFLDDDFVPAHDYFAVVECTMSDHPQVALMTGTVIADGILGPGLAFDHADRLVAEAAGSRDNDDLSPVYNGYGCNMAIRLSVVRHHGVRFDERLPQYGWLEDVDFSRRLAPFGQLVRASAARGVHLGTKAGRQPGLKFGYSQIANPLYMARKGTMGWDRALAQMGRNVAMNICKCCAPEAWVDRRGRLKGNVRAISDLITGRIDPARIESL